MNNQFEGSNSIKNLGFYSSNSIDNVQHARSLRNSILLNDTANDITNERGVAGSSNGTGSDTYTDSVWDHSIDGSQDISDDDYDGENETQTQVFKMTASPSLSALAGILSEKSKKAEERMRSRSNTFLETTIEEEEEGEQGEQGGENEDHDEKDNLLDSKMQGWTSKSSSTNTNLQDRSAGSINFNGPEVIDAKPRLSKAESNSSKCTPKPVFSDVFNEQISKHSRVTNKNIVISDGLEDKSIVSGEQYVSRSIERTRSRSISSTITDQAAIIGSGAASLWRKRMPSLTHSRTASVTEKAEKKRKSIFSFLKKKSSSASISDNAGSDAPNIPTSSTFSVAKSNSKESLAQSTKLTKKSYSSSSLFGSFRKNKKSNNAASQMANEVEKQSQTTLLGKEKIKPRKVDATRRDDDVAVRIDIDQRKPAPLDITSKTPIGKIEQRRDSTYSLSRQSSYITDSSILDTARPEISLIDPKHSSTTLSHVHNKFNGGEAVFPKSLNPHEVESIVSMERSRSQKSNRNSTQSYRRSLTDNLSINAQNEGMFITEASEVILSTPDLTKSPTNSILRNGTFDSLEIVPKASESDDYQYNLTLPQSINRDVEEGMISFSSIQEKLNELTMDTDAEDENNASGQKIPIVTPISADPEFMSEIVEFSNIIDFGDEVHFDFELNTGETLYKSLNPANDVLQPSLLDSSLSATSNGLYLEEDEKLDDEPRRVTIGVDIANEPNLESIDDYDDDFENEDFNHLEYDDEDLGMDVVDSHMVSKGGLIRPISMSFKGMNFRPNYSHDLPRLHTQIGLNYYTLDGNVKSVQFSSRVLLHDTYTEDEYDRQPDIATCNQLTPQLAQLIKEELNLVKSEMEVHEDSRCYTHFY